MERSETRFIRLVVGCGAVSLGLLGCEAAELQEDPPATQLRAADAEPLHGIDLPAPGNFGVRLVEPPSSEPQSRAELTAHVVNVGEEFAQASLFAVGLGLDGKDARLSLGVVELEPRQDLEVTIAVEEVPVQTIGHVGEMRFEALIDRGDGVVTESRSERVFLDYPEGFDEALVYDLDGAVARNAELAEREPTALLGRFLDEAGAWREVEAEAATQEPVRWGPTERIPDDFTPAPEPPPDAGKIRVCGQWMSAFVDDEVGEDVLDSPTFLISWATYASAEIRAKGSQTTLWSGHLDKYACAPPLVLSAGNYEFFLRSSFEGPQGQHVDVLYDYLVPDGLQGEFLTWFKLGFNAVPPASGTTTVNLPATTNMPVTNVSAIISAVLGRADNGLPADNYTIHTNTDCPTLPGNACAPQTELYLAGGPYGTRDDEWKFVVAHELGHNAQYAAVGIPGYFAGFSYDTVIDSEAACRCDHVTVANQLHCLQSLEHVSKAQTEGFAQFYAAHVFNTWQTDCGFAYYKEFLQPHNVNGNTINVIASPPIPVDCAVPHQWRSTYCSDIEDSGTEIDWMTAFRALLIGGVSMTDLYAIYAEACGGFTCAYANVRWDDLSAAAAVHYGSAAHPKAQLFVQIGSQHDVD